MELLALVIDRATSAEVSKINYEIGSSVYGWRHGHRFFGKLSERERLERDLENAIHDEKTAQRHGEPAEYEGLLKEYVQLKLYLHNLRKTLYYPYDSYTLPEDYKKTLARCSELKEQIKAQRRVMYNATWGWLSPAAPRTD